MVKNILYLLASFAIFLLGIVFYGIFLDRNQVTLEQVLEAKKLKEIKNAHIEIRKSKYELNLFSDTTFLKSYRIVMGRVRDGDKFVYGRTPTGKYYVCNLVDKYRYHRLIKLNFPNSSDATELLLNKQITRHEYKKILDAEKRFECPDIKIHNIENFGIQGIGKFDIIFRNLPFVFNWTNGSIALSNGDIDEIFPICKIGTEVIIRE